jgi:hypothetical protein
MGGNNPYMGQNLQNQSAGSYGQALGGASQAQQQGTAALATGAGMAGQAANQYGQMAGYNPNLQAGQLKDTNLQPYMNPYQQEVINNTMSGLDRQRQLQDQQIASTAQDQGAFGGDRFAVQQAENARNFMGQKASTMAQLNQQNFGQAQQAAGQDIASKYQADAANAAAQQRAMEASAGGLGQIGSQFGQIGQGQQQFGTTQLGNLSNQGFNYGQQIQQGQMQAGGLMQKQIQDLIDKAQAQQGGANAQPETGLGVILKSLQGTYNPTVSKSSTDPGMGGMVSAVGALAGK